MSLARYALIFSAVFSLVANGPLAVMAAAHTDPAAALMEAGDELTGQDRGGRPHGGPRAADDQDGKKDADEKEGRGDGPGRSREDDEDGPGRGRRGSQRAISGLVSAVATDTFTVDSVVIKVDGNTRYQRPGQGRDKPDFGDVTSGVKVHVLAVRIVPASASGPQWLARKVQLPRTRLKFAHWIGTINTITNLGSIKIIDRDGAEHEAVIDAQSRQLPTGATFAAGDRVLIHAMRGDDGKWVALLLVKLGPPNPGGTPTPAPAPDASVPTVTGVDSPTANGSYGAGGSIRVAVAFSEAVTVIGAPQITLETGGSDAGANYFSGSGTNTLTFVYNVAAGQASNDLDYASTSALTLPAGAAIRDAAGNNAVLTLPVMGQPGSLGANKAIVINTSTDATSPSVVSVSS
ncbi:MAG: hypothetical protein EXR51_11160, partial [Dehalococcoidia bacterium]|nr:hypothetical protein [Dehalococcoidia bacterium]